MSSTEDVFVDSAVRVWLGDTEITTRGEVRISSPHAAGPDVEIVIPVDTGVLGEEVTVSIPRHRLVDHLNTWWHTVTPRFSTGDTVWLLGPEGQMEAVIESDAGEELWMVRTAKGLTRSAGRFLTPRQKSDVGRDG
ncbi:hypothetical protein [Mycobacteroides abscessus]|uniref:hypothetical protein n=1 Tax=Mycobacteroides abscessus TaxID=36809 RepID=UPI000925BCA9|nr:hypothetical protein [Mycobacteroides abscessus]SHP22732.1 Uncharacterised protein [Mycobacteroides abscessus subsp. abscessus]